MARIVELEIKNLRSLIRALRDAPKISAPVLANAINATLATIQKHATRPIVPWRTGRLTQSFGEGIRLATPARLIGSIGPTVRYAIFVHEGTKPHDIFPVTRQALFWPGAEHPVKHVSHPGTRANPFLERIVRRVQPEAEKLFKQAGDIIAREIAKQTNQF